MPAASHSQSPIADGPVGQVKPENGNGSLLRPRVRLVAIHRPPRNELELEELRFSQAMLHEAAQRDGHHIMGATHLVMRGEECVGYVSIAGLPVMHTWLDSQRIHAGESLRVQDQVDALLNDRFGGSPVLVPCPEESPFTPHMERLGYERLGPTMLYLKRKA